MSTGDREEASVHIRELVKRWSSEELDFYKDNHYAISVGILQSDPLTLGFSVFTESDVYPLYEGKKQVSGGKRRIWKLMQTISAWVSKIAKHPPGGGIERKKSYYEELDDAALAVTEACLPDGLIDLIGSWEPDSVIRISTEENFVPWELLTNDIDEKKRLHEKKGFFGTRFTVFRYYRADRESLATYIRNEGNGSDAHSVGKPVAVHVVGGDLTVSEIERFHAPVSSYCSRVGLTISKLEQEELSSVLEAISGAQLVHLTCHGELRPIRLQISNSHRPDTCLTAQSLASERFFAQEGSFVFANACNSASTELHASDFISLASGFVAKGCCAFLGSLGVIPIAVAEVFSRHFYESLAGQNQTLVAAFESAKRIFTDITELPFLYAFYGSLDVAEKYRINH